MKIGIISFNQKKYMPYLEFYINMLNDYNIQYDCYTWNRSNEVISIDENKFCFQKSCHDHYIKKAIVFLQWRKWILYLLRRNKYDRLIILTTIPGVLLYPYLKRYYRNRFIIDIRDYTYEKIFIYKLIVSKLIENSSMCCISSEGFMKFLPNSPKIRILHNLPYNSKASSVTLQFDKFNIGYFGVFSYFEINKSLIEQVSNKESINLFYVGSFKEKKNILKEYVDNEKIKNVFFCGSFRNNEKEFLYKKYNINFINAIYGHDSILVTSALPNKLYDCLLYKIPIIVSKKTFLSEIVEKYELGISIEIDDDICVACKEYIKKFHYGRFLSNTELYLTHVRKQNSETLKCIKEFLNC